MTWKKGIKKYGYRFYELTTYFLITLGKRVRSWYCVIKTLDTVGLDFRDNFESAFSKVS